MAAVQRCADAVDHRHAQVVDEQRVQAGIVDDVLELGAGQPEIQRHEDRADGGSGVHRLDEGRVVRAQKTHAVPAVDARTAQGAGKQADARA